MTEREKAEDLASMFDGTGFVSLQVINEDRLFASEPGWVDRDLTTDEIALVARALRMFSDAETAPETKG